MDDSDFVLPSVELDDDTITESGDETIFQHDNAIFSDSDDSTCNNGWQFKFKNITLAILSNKAKVKNTLDDEDCPALFFERFFDQNLINHTMKETNLYEVQRGAKNRSPTTADEIKAYFLMLILKRIHQLPSIDHYWCNDPALHLKSIAEIMTCKRFKKIRQCLYCNDNSQAKNRSDSNFDIFQN